ncbi:MAG: DUF1116 domain-containing protein [Bacillota bacterium]
MSKFQGVLTNRPKVLNLGLKSIGETIAQHTDMHLIDWKPPGWGNSELARIVATLLPDSTPGTVAEKVQHANQTALSRMLESEPVLVDVKPALEVLPGMTENTILHAGPPVEWENMCGPMKGAVIGALIYEGRAKNADEAVALAGSGKIKYAPCHSKNAVGPMAGVISPSMPVWVVKNKTFGNLAFSTMNEGWGRTLRFGAYDKDVIERLIWMQETLAPAMKLVIEKLDGIDLKNMIAQALQMGDECHNRDIAVTNLFFKIATPVLVDSDFPQNKVRQVVKFLGDHEHFFLNLAMAACKACLVAAQDIPYCSMVTAMARNGVEVGIQVSGMGNQWFTETASVAHGLYFPGYSEEDANPDIGDSAITETGGIGAFVMGSSPAIVQFVGGTPEDALAMTREMYQITLGKNNNYRLPGLSFAGSPTGIDIVRVADTGILPIINTGIAHKEPGHGLVGAGIVRAPQGCFEKALRAFGEKYTDNDLVAIEES